MNMTDSVLERYSQGAKERQAELCCPVDYDPKLLEMIPDEILEKDYGCGDPSRYACAGDVVLDLGSGGGKVCYMAARLVGPEGRVIGVDMNDDMLALARKYQGEMARRLGSDRVRFLKGHIQDLALDLEALQRQLAAQPVRNAADLAQLHDWQARQRRESPLIADGSVDLVISNCVLNLVRDEDKAQLVREVQRVLKPGGRVAISDIVSDEEVPAHIKRDPQLWSGCIAGVYQEEAFLRAFADAGFLAVRYDKWDGKPWRVIDGIEFRAVTLTAVTGSGEPCLDCGHAVIYRGPYAEVRDDEGHVYPRGARMAVCERTFRLLTQGPYRDDFIGIEPALRTEPRAFCQPPGARRPAADTKGGRHAGVGCATPGCC
jgi:ubiquinone/menaquinone biosynthesis C-methylase UbiE